MGTVTKMKQVMAVASIPLLLLSACAAPLTPRESGTLTGAGLGAATGAVLGGIAGSAGKGAAVGAVVGALTGALAGNAIQNEEAARASSRAYAYPPPPYPYDAPYAPQPLPPDASLQLEVAPEDTEIVVDGRRIGLAKDFSGPAMVPVAAGSHNVEFHWRGFSITNQIMVSPRTTVVIRRDLGPSAFVSPQPGSPGEPRRPLY